MENSNCSIQITKCEDETAAASASSTTENQNEAKVEKNRNIFLKIPKLFHLKKKITSSKSCDRLGDKQKQKTKTSDETNRSTSEIGKSASISFFKSKKFTSFTAAINAQFNKGSLASIPTTNSESDNNSVRNNLISILNKNICVCEYASYRLNAFKFFRIKKGEKHKNKKLLLRDAFL